MADRVEIDTSSVAAEIKRMDERLDAIPMRSVFIAARRMASRKHGRQPNWVFAMDLFGLGSTYAWRMCKRMGFDPDSSVPAVVSPVSAQKEKAEE